MTYNEPLLRQAVEYIENNPEEWNQAFFIGSNHVGSNMSDCSKCGTTRCLAGTVVAIAREKWSYEELAYSGSIADSARKLLGFGEEEAEDIFYFFTSSINALKARITDVTGIEFKKEG